MTAGLWFYGLIFFTGAFLWNWRRRLKNDLELVEVANSHDQKQTNGLNQYPFKISNLLILQNYVNVFYLHVLSI